MAATFGLLPQRDPTGNLPPSGLVGTTALSSVLVAYSTPALPCKVDGPASTSVDEHNRTHLTANDFAALTSR
jgi:hypothetical protein